MILYDATLPCIAISYQSTTFHDLKWFLEQDHDIELQRVEPENLDDCASGQFINLITDMSKRKTVSSVLDQRQMPRFSYIHSSSTVMPATIQGGLFMYPGCVIYSNVIIGKDVLVHFGSAIAHGVTIGQGTFLSGGVIIAGSTSVGEFCWFGLHASVGDKISIANNVTVAANTFIRKSITNPGTYYCPASQKVRML